MIRVPPCTAQDRVRLRDSLGAEALAQRAVREPPSAPDDPVVDPVVEPAGRCTTTVTDVMTVDPLLWLMRSAMSPLRNRSSVAHAGSSTDTVSSPSFKRSGRLWAASTGPTTASQSPNTDTKSSGDPRPSCRATVPSESPTGRISPGSSTGVHRFHVISCSPARNRPQIPQVYPQTPCPHGLSQRRRSRRAPLRRPHPPGPPAGLR